MHQSPCQRHALGAPQSAGYRSISARATAQTTIASNRSPAPRIGQGSRRGGLLCAAALTALGIAGCATDGQMGGPFASLMTQRGHPTESGFRTMIEASCGEKSVGDSTVAALMRSDSSFNELIASLYSGDISNDEFLNQVLLEHPATDANVPATGCIIDELAQCFAYACKPQTPEQRAEAEKKQVAEAEQITDEVTIDPVELPSKDKPEIEQMIETSKEEGPKPLP